MSAKLSITGETLCVEMIGWHKIWSFKGQISVPIGHVESIRMGGEEARDWLSGIKLIGARVPKLIKAGTFRTHGEQVFWDVRDPDKAVMIDLHDEKFAKLIIEVADPQAAIAEVEQAIAQSGKSGTEGGQ
ncbi:hypothetical protein [Thiorhodococcus fuscus]|uniref:Uncharacterized protein n=1 Tax=Thiorhodococcus fuscus TaxID=527200 RepID=A0ABW4Y7R0_9GAMM